MQAGEHVKAHGTGPSTKWLLYNLVSLNLNYGFDLDSCKLTFC